MINNYKIIFLSGLFPKELEQEIMENSIYGIQNAANNLQWQILEGLVFHTKGSLRVINSIYIGSYPYRYKKIAIKKSLFHIDNNEYKGINTFFINLPFIKQYSKYFSIKRKLDSEIIDKNTIYVLIGYAMTNHITRILMKYRHLSNVKTILVVPDLPEYMNFSKKKTGLWKIFKNESIKSNYRNCKYISGFVFLTQKMADLNQFINKPYAIIDGITRVQENFLNSTFEKNEKFTVMYSGSLNKEYGVNDLLDAFDNIHEDNINLIICGDGGLKNQIIEKSKIDKRIEYLGVLPRAQVISLQKQSSVLINPRKNSGEFTKYSFPSKIIEYMSSGTPVLMYKLDGVSEEYYDKVFLIDNYSSIDLAILDLYNKNTHELKTIGKKAKDFIEEYKNPVTQTQKIITLINKL